MSASRVLSVVALLGTPGAAFAQSFGTNGTSCNHSSLQTAIDNATLGTVWVSDAVHSVTGTLLVDDDVAIVGANATCTSGSSGRPEIRKSGGGRLFDVTDGALLELEDLDATQGSTSGTGGTIRADLGADVYLHNVVVSGGYAEGDGGCISAGNESFVGLYDGSDVSDCDSLSNGGNVALGWGAVLSVDGTSRLLGGWALGDGGNLLIEGTAQATISGYVLDGHADGNGGGIAMRVANGGTSPYLGAAAEIARNVAEGDGGGVWVQQGANDAWIDLYLSTRVTDNEAVDGGGFWLGGGTLESWAVWGNTAFVAWNVATGAGTTHGGGGLWVEDATVTGRYLEVHGNDALFGVGGGMYAIDGTVDLVNAAFVSNEAGHVGGLLVESGTLALDADFSTCTPAIVAGEWEYCSRVDQNVAIGGVGNGRTGGVLVSNGTTADIEHTGFRGNYSFVNGGALVVGGAASTAEVRNCLFDDNQGFMAANNAVWAISGNLEVYASTFLDNAVPLVWNAAATGELHRSAFDDNTSDVSLHAGITGDCSVVQAAAGLPTGANNVFGNANLDPYGHPTAASALVLNQCTTGPADDILGNVRPLFGGVDRGAVEY